MEFLDSVFAALNAGVEQIFGAPLDTLLIGYAAWLVYQGRAALMRGVPAIFHAAVASAVDAFVMPMVRNAVRAGEEYGERLAKEAIAKGKAALDAKFSEAKLTEAKAYIKRRISDRLVSDETIEQWINAALVSVGRGATKGITVAVDYVEGAINNAPAPPPAA